MVDEEATKKAQEEADKRAAEEGKEAEKVEPVMKTENVPSTEWKVGDAEGLDRVVCRVR